MDSNEKVWLKLYIIKKSAGSTEMVKNLKLLLDKRMKQAYKLEVIDILTDPEMAIRDKILASPTLIKTQPFPEKRIIGKLAFNNLIEELEIR